MTDTGEQPSPAMRQFTLGDGLLPYVGILAQRASGSIIFRTGAGRLLRDLMIHWPTLEDWENEALELCERITDAACPLTNALFAQAVEMTITISPRPIAPPAHLEALSTYIIFDSEQRIERHVFLSPEAPLPANDLLRTGKGIAILCRPLNYRYHTIKDDRKRTGHPHAGIFELSQRLINEMYLRPDFVPREHQILATMKKAIVFLPKALAQDSESRSANLAVPTRHLTPVKAPIQTTTSLSSLPPPVRALERNLMSAAIDKTLSADLRLGLRRIAQTLRAQYPQAVLEEAARRETVPRVLRPTPAATPAQRPQPRPTPAAQPRQRQAPVTTRTPVASPRPITVPLYRFVPPPLSSRVTPPVFLRPSVVLPVTHTAGLRATPAIVRTTTPVMARTTPAARPQSPLATQTQRPAATPTADVRTRPSAQPQPRTSTTQAPTREPAPQQTQRAAAAPTSQPQPTTQPSARQPANVEPRASEPTPQRPQPTVQAAQSRPEAAPQRAPTPAREPAPQIQRVAAEPAPQSRPATQQSARPQPPTVEPRKIEPAPQRRPEATPQKPQAHPAARATVTTAPPPRRSEPIAATPAPQKLAPHRSPVFEKAARFTSTPSTFVPHVDPFTARHTAPTASAFPKAVPISPTGKLANPTHQPKLKPQPTAWAKFVETPTPMPGAPLGLFKRPL